MTLPLFLYGPRPRVGAASLRTTLRAAILAAAVASWGTLAAASPLLSEVFYDASGSDDGEVFVELAGTPGASVDGLVIEGINGSDGSVTVSLELAGSFGSDGLFVVADVDAEGATAVAGADQLLSFDFQNGPDSVVLRDALGVALDALGYGAFDAGQVFAGEGAPAPDAPAGSSLARLDLVDRGDNALDFAVTDTPTPGVGPAPVPEPSLAVLLAVASAALRRRGR